MSTYDDWPATTEDGWTVRKRPARPDPKEATDEELGAEPIANGPTEKNHMAYCKQRALTCLPDAGQVMSSLMQDFTADPRTADSADVVQHLMLPLTIIGEFSGPAGEAKLRKFVLDFS